MTKIFYSPLLLDYRQYISDLSSRCIKSRYIAGVNSWESGEPFPALAGLLPSPCIEHINLEIYEGKVHDLILLIVSEEFGLSNVHLMLKDEDGNVIESGDAFVCMDHPDIWNYFTTASVPSGAEVTVQAIATDRLCGIGTWSETKIIP